MTGSGRRTVLGAVARALGRDILDEVWPEIFAQARALNHLVLVDVFSKGLTGKVAEVALEKVGISCSRSTIPFDTRKALDPSGIRLGTPAGCVQTFVEHDDDTPVVGVVRTYRRLASGTVLLPDPPLLPSVSA